MPGVDLSHAGRKPYFYWPWRVRRYSVRGFAICYPTCSFERTPDVATFRKSTCLYVEVRKLMQAQRFPRLLVLLAVGAVAVATLVGCGSGGSSGNKNIVIATLLPVSGGDASVGLPTQYGADLAISQNANLGNGYHLSVLHENYEGANGPDTTIGATVTRSIVSNPNVVAVIGPFNSGIAKVAIPITNAAGLTMISPSNTNPGLTKQQYATANGIDFALLHPAGKPDAYFRTCGTDDVQGKVDADVALGAPINAKTAFVIDDETVYGKGLATQFTAEFTAKGGKILGTGEISATQISEAPQLATAIKGKNPDAV